MSDSEEERANTREKEKEEEQEPQPKKPKKSARPPKERGKIVFHYKYWSKGYNVNKKGTKREK